MPMMARGRGVFRGRGLPGPGRVARTPYMQQDDYFGNGGNGMSAQGYGRGRARPNAGLKLYPGFGPQTEFHEDDNYFSTPGPIVPRKKLNRGEPYPPPNPPDPSMLGVGPGPARGFRRGGGFGMGRGYKPRNMPPSAASTTTIHYNPGQEVYDSDPFAPSAVEKKRMEQQQNEQQQLGDPSIDFTADIMLS